MSNDMKMNITKLATDGSNWVTYWDCMLFAFNSRRWMAHLNSPTIPAAYTAVGDINGVTPDERWASEEAAASQLIAASVPDHVFNRIKTKANTMEIWDTVKAIYQS
jgi:hypothetical protein